MNTRYVDEASVHLPARPWMIGGGGAPCLVCLQGLKLIPVFRTSAACRAFMARNRTALPDAFYPLFPDEWEFVGLLSIAMREGAEGYVLVYDDRWSVLGFGGPLAPRAAAPVPEAVCH